MKDNRLKGIIALAVVTVVAFGLIYGSRLITNDRGGATNQNDGNIDIGNAEGIREAREIHDDNGNVIGYAVTAFTRGFGGDIMMEVTFESDAKTLQSLNIISHGETPGYGAVVEDDEYLSQFPGKLAPIFLEGTAPVVETPAEGEGVAQNEEEAPTQAELQDGTYTTETEAFSATGYKDTVTITVANGAITNVVWDAYNEAGQYKSVLSLAGEYVMTEDGPTWQEQAEAMAAYLVQTQDVNAINTDDAGKTDSVAGVSISVGTFVNLVKTNLEKAAGISPNTLKDGIYRVQDEEFDNKGWLDTVTLKVENGAITSVVWDSMNESGEYKSYLSTAGKYIMVEGNPTWKQQADALATFVIEKQGISELLLNSTGNTDSVAGVSIFVGGFVKKVEEALRLASLGEGVPVKDPESPVVNTPAAGAENSEIDAISGATVTSKAVVEGVNKAYNFISEYVNR